jgi:prepilin-type N-terminal cleavage/methylation domain-containing protein
MKTEKVRGFTPTPIYIGGEKRKNMQKRVRGQITVSFAINKLVRGFTLIELLTAVTIIAIQVKKLAGSAKQKAQNSSIEIGLTLYRNDMGEYPQSHGLDLTLTDPNDYKYSGAHTLAEAMFGYDLLGVHPNTVFRLDGLDKSGNPTIYPTGTGEPNAANLGNRKGPYLDRTNIGVYEPNQIFTTLGSLSEPGHMICDVFTFKSKKIGNKRCKIGTPVLYFRANLSPVNAQSISYPIPPSSNFDSHTRNVYNYGDNLGPIAAGRLQDNGGIDHKLYETTGNPTGSIFYNFIRDPMIPKTSGTYGRPVRPDSFLLISAGFDGLYGTRDDICNFEPNIE